MGGPGSLIKWAGPIPLGRGVVWTPLNRILRTQRVSSHMLTPQIGGQSVSGRGHFIKAYIGTLCGGSQITY